MTSQNDGKLHPSDYVAVFLTLLVGYRVFFAILHTLKMHCKYREGNKKYYIDEIDLKQIVRKMKKNLSDSDYLVRNVFKGDA